MPSILDDTSHTYSHEEIALILRIQLLDLSYLAFATCARSALSRIGYQNVYLSTRRHLKGRTDTGGTDLGASLETPLGLVPVAGQIKRYGRIPVSRRYVDELRGTLLRLGISHGLILTTGTFSKAAIEAARTYPGRPVRLVDGAELSRLMVEAEIGCSSTTDILSGETRYFFLERSFAELERSFATIQPPQFNF